MSNEAQTYGTIVNVSLLVEFDPALIYGQNDMAIKLVLGLIRTATYVVYGKQCSISCALIKCLRLSQQL